MDWMVIARIWMDKQNSDAYALGFRKLFEKCKLANHNFEVGATLQGIVTDWSDAQIKGLQCVIGEETAMKLLKGCKVHWLRSCERVSDCISKSRNKQMERDVLMKIAAKVQTLPSAIDIVACFETIFGARPTKLLLEKLPGICSEDEAL